jgi:hypothetical protein
MSDLSPALKPAPDTPLSIVRIGADAARPEAARYKTLYGHETVTLGGETGLGEAPVAAIFTTFLYAGGSDCRGDIRCYSTVQLRLPSGNATHRGTLSGPGQVSAAIHRDSLLLLASPPELPAGLFVSSGSLALPTAPQTPLVTRGGLDSSLYLAHQGTLAALDLGGRLVLTGGEAGHRQASVCGGLYVREGGGFAPTFAAARDDGITYHADQLTVDGDILIEQGAVLSLPTGPQGLVFPPSGLPLLSCKGERTGRFEVTPQRHWYRTEWQGDTLYVFNREQTLLCGRMSLPAAGRFGCPPVVADGATLLYRDGEHCDDDIEWIHAGNMNFTAVTTEAVHGGHLGGMAPLTLSTPSASGQAILACTVDLPAGMLIVGSGRLLLCGDAARTPFTVHAALVCASRILSAHVATGMLAVSTGCHPTAQRLKILGNLAVDGPGQLGFSLIGDALGTIRDVDCIEVDGDVTFARGASLHLNNYVPGMPIPAAGLALLHVHGHIDGAMPELVATIGLYTEWTGRTLYLRQAGSRVRADCT